MQKKITWKFNSIQIFWSNKLIYQFYLILIKLISYLSCVLFRRIVLQYSVFIYFRWPCLSWFRKITQANNMTEKFSLPTRFKDSSYSVWWATNILNALLVFIILSINTCIKLQGRICGPGGFPSAVEFGPRIPRLSSHWIHSICACRSGRLK